MRFNVNLNDIFGDMLDVHTVTFEVYVEDKLIGKQSQQAPKEMLKLNFMQTMEQISKDQKPMKIKMIREEVIWDNFENTQKTLYPELSFSNNAMIAWEERNQ